MIKFLNDLRHNKVQTSFIQIDLITGQAIVQLCVWMIKFSI